MLQHTTQQQDIKPLLVKYLTQGKHKIQLAIGWMNDSALVGLLQKKALENVTVQLLLIKDKNNAAYETNYTELAQQGVQITWLDAAFREQLIDHKFAVIDEAIVLTGNYNWGHKNAPKEEKLTITEGVPTLGKGFAAEFDFLSVIHQLPEGEKRPATVLTALLKKLDILKVLLNMDDTEFIHLRLKELENFPPDKNVKQIHEALLAEQYAAAYVLIQNFLDYHQPLRACIDPPIDILRREIQRLEEEITEVSNEFNETQKTLHQFSKAHTENLGDLLQKILMQSKVKAAMEAQQDAEKQADYEEAKKDHEDYTKSHIEAKKQKVAALTPAEQKELKKLYRKTSLKCHPDRVVEEMAEEAEALFVELNQAYKANDLERLRELDEQLKAGIMLSKSEGITELKKLESTVGTLTQKLNDWLAKLDELQATPSYQTVSGIEDWATYFEETKGLLEDQLKRLVDFNRAAGTNRKEVSLLG